MLIELSIHEGILHQRLAIVEHTIYLYGGNVLAKGGKLALLNGADLTLGIEYIYMNAVDTEESVSHSRTCVTRGGYEHIHLLPLALLTDEVLQQARHKAGTHILESEGRSMKEFEGVDIVFHLGHRAVERQGVVDNIVEGIRIYIFTKESIGYSVGNFLKTHFVDILEEFFGQFIDTLRHIESAIFCETFHNCFVQISYRSLIIRTVVLHIFII